MKGLYVEVAGSGPPLVLLHGWAMHGGVFAPWLPLLQARHTVHVVDLPGHGHSRDCEVPLHPEACMDAIAAVVPQRAHWCGWSLGGSIALHVASRNPDAIASLTMLCATPKFVVAPDWPHGMPREVFTGFAEGLRDDWRGTLARFIALEAMGSDHVREELQLLQQALFVRGEPAPRVLADGLALLEATDLRDRLPALRVPSLWIGGRRDRLVDPRAVQAAAGQAPGAQVQVVAQAGHAPFLTHAAEVDAIHARFLAEVA